MCIRDRLHYRFEHDPEETADIHRRTEGEGAEDEGDRPVHRLETAAFHEGDDIVRRLKSYLRIDIDAVVGQDLREGRRVFAGAGDLRREHGDVAVLHDVQKVSDTYALNDGEDDGDKDTDPESCLLYTSRCV